MGLLQVHRPRESKLCLVSGQPHVRDSKRLLGPDPCFREAGPLMLTAVMNAWRGQKVVLVFMHRVGQLRISSSML